MSIYEVHLGSWRLNSLERNRSLTYEELADELAAYVRRARLHPRRAAAGDGAPVLGLVGLPGQRLLRAHVAPRHAGRLPPVRRPAAPGRRRRDPRLGAGALPARRLGARPVRRHRALRARRPAPRRASRLGNARLQLRPHRGAELPRRERALLAALLPRRRSARRRRRLDALPRLLARARRVDPEPLRRQRGSRGDRVPARAERGHSRPRARRRSWRPRSRPPGPASRARRRPAGSASGSSGTWAGCTTRSTTSRTTRSTAPTTTTA